MPLPDNPKLQVFSMEEVRAGFVNLLDLVRDLAENGADEGACEDVARRAHEWVVELEEAADTDD